MESFKLFLDVNKSRGANLLAIAFLKTLETIFPVVVFFDKEIDASKTFAKRFFQELTHGVRFGINCE